MAGTITFSMEVELAWGLHDLENFGQLAGWDFTDRSAETRALGDFLAACEEHGIPVSFDTVGHLFEHSCSGTHDGPHPTGWFARDPGTNHETDPYFYAPDLIEMIRDASVTHEICTHTYSHVPCGEVSPDTVRWELARSADVHGTSLGGLPVSLVPPRHSPPPRDVLRASGIEIVRTPVDVTASPTRFHVFIDDLLASHPVREPALVDEIVETYSTQSGCLNATFLPSQHHQPHPVYRILPMAVRKRAQKRSLQTGLRQAIERDSHAHFWTHLRDITSDHQLDVIRWFFETVAAHRNDGTVDVVTMRDLNEQVRA